MTNEISFQGELSNLLNRHSAENESNTPDFILAKYLLDCLTVFNSAVKRREDWRYGSDASKKVLELRTHDTQVARAIVDGTTYPPNESIRAKRPE